MWKHLELTDNLCWLAEEPEKDNLIGVTDGSYNRHK